MSRFGGLSEERPSEFKTRSKLGTHLSTQCSGDERQSRPCASRNRTPDLWRKQLNSAAGTKQLNLSVGTKQLNSALPSTAYKRLQPPTTACTPPAPPLQQNRLFLPTHDNLTRLVRTVILRHYMKDRGRVIGQVDRNQENSKDLGKHRVRRVTVVNQIRGSEHWDQKRPTPEPKQGIKRAIPSSVSSRNYKYRRPNNPSQGSQSIAGPSHPRDSRQDKPPTEGSRHEGSGQYDKARETRATINGTNRAAERRPVRSKQVTAVRPCPYYLRSRVRQPEGFPEERKNIGIESIPQNNIRRTSLSMEALDGDPVDRSE
ncbi:uncharacterized protein TNCV_5099081 [Trichonephila clavipes]|uniref:Uncharacterized protein n=1 Tax=Trichonephila clavipes TaxID=2585209 RepID=A0A8X6V2D9_TRICX|nr:uncharacterized protein TNCV_5099081 [Trichonephila clavipes]